MPAPTSEFNAYQLWLGIPPEELPPNHYRLLGLNLFEKDKSRINSAALRQMAHVRRCGLGANIPHARRLLTEIAAAQECLTQADTKAAYDDNLAHILAAKATSRKAQKPVHDASNIFGHEKHENQRRRTSATSAQMSEVEIPSESASGDIAELTSIAAQRTRSVPRKYPLRRKKSSGTAIALFGLGIMMAVLGGLAILYTRPNWITGLTPHRPPAHTQNLPLTTVNSPKNNVGPTAGPTALHAPNRPISQQSVASSTLNWHKGPLPGQLFFHEGNSGTDIQTHADSRDNVANTATYTPKSVKIAKLPIPTPTQIHPVRAWAQQVAIAFSPKRVLMKAVSEPESLRQYALLIAALHAAVRHGDVIDAVHAENIVIQRFQVNPLTERAKLILHLGKTTHQQRQCAILAQVALQVSAQAHAAGPSRTNQETARHCERVALLAAQAAGSRQLIRRASLALRNDHSATTSPVASPSHADVNAMINPSK